MDISLQDDNLTYLAVFVNDVKTQLKIFPGNEVEKALSLPITLEEGLNEIRLIATDKDDVTSVLPLRVWGVDAQGVDDKGLAEVTP